MSSALACQRPIDNEPLDEPLRLHIGGQAAKEGWKILNIQGGPHVDFIGSCTDLDQFEDHSVAAVYASHVLEHLDYVQELPHTLKEIHRILQPDGNLYISVPDLECLTQLFLHKEFCIDDRFMIMRMMFGGQADAFDYHKVGLTWEFLCHFISKAGFPYLTRVPEHQLFQDTSSMRFAGQLISLNAVAHKTMPDSIEN